MDGYVYTGACGELISESWHGDTYCVQCQGGRGMQVDGGCNPLELCDGCAKCEDV